MTTLWITIFWATILLSAASYFLYPALVWLWGRLLPFKPRRSHHQPSVSILIAAYNEERDIAAKLTNTLKLDYPPEQIEILVGSDGSTDQTPHIVKTFADRGVRLLDFEENRGKTAVQNDLVAASRGEILVFTDAASFLPPEAIGKLVRCFADHRVGCVAGRMRFVDTDRNITTASQGLYWRYESNLRQWESDIGRLIGVDGPLYAMRRENFVTLPHHIISDFLAPLLVLQQNRRVVLDPEAVVDEDPTGKPQQELKTRRRITLRGLVGLFHYPALMNPLKNPMLGFQIFFHKLLRWAVGPMVLLNFLASLILSDLSFFHLFLLMHLLFYACALFGLASDRLGKSYKIFTLPYYFCLVNFAATLGIFDFLRKKDAKTWIPVRDSTSNGPLAQHNNDSIDTITTQKATSVWYYLKHDLNRYWYKDTKFIKKIKIVFLTQGIWATIIFRFGASLYLQKTTGHIFFSTLLPFFTVLSKVVEVLTGISIPFATHIGPGLYIGHFGAIIIGKNTIIGSNCNISQGVTIGQAGRGGNQLSPTIGNRVYIGPGAKIFGGIQIGNDVAIGANSVVTKNVPPSAVVAGVPAKVINYESSSDFIVT